MTDDWAWTEEKLFWTGGEEHYRRMLDDECIMVFPAPAGIIAARTSRAPSRMRPAGRWSR